MRAVATADAVRMTLTALPAQPAPPRMPLWTKVTLVVLAAVLVPSGALVMWFLVAFSGGLDDLIGSTPEPDDARVVEAREHGEQHVSGELADVVPAASAALGGSTQLGQATGDECVVGQHNWKIDDDFDLYCTHGRGVVLRGDPARFREDALALHAALVADGWVAGSGTSDMTVPSGIPRAVTEYWDARADFPGEVYSPADLPSADYVRGSSRLLVQWVEAGADTSVGHPLYESTWESTTGRTVAPRDAGQLVPSGDYGTTLVVSTEYFRD